MKHTMFVDAETDGLYGETIAIAAIVVDEAETEIDRFYEQRKINTEDLENDWTKEHVVPLLGESRIWDTEEQLLESFWQFYRKYSKSDIIADVAYPVEANVFRKCIRLNQEERQYEGPFPLLDLSSMLYVAAPEYILERKAALAGEWQEHNALSDVCMSYAMWKKYIKEKQE